VGEVLVRRAWRRTVPLAALVGLVFAAPAAADLSGLGAETAVGVNATGEACRIRVTEEDAGRGYQRLSLFCDGWSAPSGTLHRFRAPRDYMPARLLTDSTFQRGYE